MPFQASFEVQGAKEWGFYEPEIRYIQDSFNRSATSGTLGVSTNGQPWNILAGIWYVNSSYQAETDNTVSSGVGPYPLASFDLVDINQLGYINVSPGIGLAFSIQDANNWYAVIGYDSETPYSCNCAICCSCCTCTYGCVTGANCSACGTSCNSCNTGGVYYANNCTECGSACISCQYGCITGPDCPICGSTCNCISCNCSTCYNYYYYISVLQNVNGTISTVNTTSITQDAASISVELKTGIVNYYAYSTNISGIIAEPYGLGTVLASGTFTISGTFGTQIGMVKSPSYYIQGTTTSGFYGTGL